MIADLLTGDATDLLYKIPNSVPISAREWLNVDELIEVRYLRYFRTPSLFTHRVPPLTCSARLKQTMWDRLDLVRIYTKPKGKQPDYTAPVVLKRARCTVEGEFAKDSVVCGCVRD